MQGLILTILLMISIIMLITSPSSCEDTRVVQFDVFRYGALGNGKTDDSQAFLKAWSHVCKASQAGGIPTLVIPKGKAFLLKPVGFVGPCNSNTVIVQVDGTILAPQNTDQKWKGKSNYWIHFSRVNGLVVTGDGSIDGQGPDWWKACSPNKESPGCTNRPTALHFHKCNGLQLTRLRHLNSQKNHISINHCNDVHISNLEISAPEKSPNTDGIDISVSRNIEIKDSVIRTGDDCIAINGGSSYINISNVACGPGHGISIGSLGHNGQYDKVEEVHVRNCIFTGTQNGARIKTWKGGRGYARKITFENIRVKNTGNPIIIDQDYDPVGIKAGIQKAVQVSDVTYKNVRGTAANELAIVLACSKGKGCTNIVLDEINIKSSIPGKKTYSRCNNVHGTAIACIPAVPCIEDRS